MAVRNSETPTFQPPPLTPRNVLPIGDGRACSSAASEGKSSRVAPALGVAGSPSTHAHTAKVASPHTVVAPWLTSRARKQPLPILLESGVRPHGPVGTKPDKSAKRKIVVELLDQHTLAADRVEHLQQ